MPFTLRLTLIFAYFGIRAAKRTNNPHAKLKCTDISKKAIEFSKELSEQEGISHMIDFDVYRISRVNEMEPPEEYDGAGTHGHVDYLTPEKGVELFKKISKVLKPGGKIITTNMKDKKGLTKFMMEFFANWHLDYKTEQEVGNMLTDAGFDDVETWATPLDYHVIATGRKC